MKPNLRMIGKGTVIHPSAVLRAGTTVGRNCIIGPNVVIGMPSFWFSLDKNGRPERNSHVTGATIGNDVEIGANCTIDYGCTLGDAVKLDNLVHIGHDCNIGDNCILIAGTVLGGYVTLGRGSRLCLNTTVKQRVTIGEGSFIGMSIVIDRNVKAGSRITQMSKLAWDTSAPAGG